MVCSAASAASTSSGEELLQSRDVDIARATACAINPGRVGCDPKAKPVVYGRRAPPANQVNNATNNTATNNASVDNNKGAIGNGGNTVKEKDECRIMVGSRSLHKRSEHEHKEHEHKEHDHKSHDQSKRGTPPPKPQGGGGQKGQGGGGKPPAPAGGNKDKAQGGGGKDKGGSGDKPGAQAGGDKKKKPVDPNSLTWKPAKTTTDAKGEVYYESKCYCNWYVIQSCQRYSRVPG